MLYFTPWQIATSDLRKLIIESDASDGDPVWRGADGSYAVGFPGPDDEDLNEYVQEGVVGDWRADDA